MHFPMTPRIEGVEHTPLLDHIGKVEVSKGTLPEVISYLMKANPHTVKINGKYSK